MNIKTEIIIEDKDADVLYNAIKPEMIDRERTRLKIKKEGNKLIMNAESGDAIAFRATFNSVSQMLAVFEKMRNLKQ